MRLYWIFPILSLIVLVSIWNIEPFAPVESSPIILDSTEGINLDSSIIAGDTIVVYEKVEVPMYVQHQAPQVTIFDWTREIMTFIIGAGNIFLLIRRKNATN